MKKRIISLMLMAVLTLSMVGCGSDSTNNSTNDASDDADAEEITYNIVACVESDDEEYQVLLQGFTDAISDYVGENATITVLTVDDDTSTDAIATQAVEQQPDLIYTVGKQMLLSATTATEDIPIVAAGVVDFKGTLRIANTDGGSWDKTTGMNVTGVSSKPSIVDQVSLMIEATEDLQTVGLLFSPEDTDSIYQNEIFENYLDQAGIPWKEYIIPASDTAIEEIEDTSSTALAPNKTVASSAKAGVDNDVVVLGDEGDNSDAGINSPSSTRVASQSEYWTGGKIVEETETTTDESTDETTDEESADETSDTEEEETEETMTVAEREAAGEEVTLEDRIQEACDECSAIYIPYGSMLTDQMETISEVANESGVVTVAGDTTIGEYALVTLFWDPYDLGYLAGKKAVRVFDGDDISTIKIGYGSTDDLVKLYNGEIAEMFGLEFPKSFSEFTEFLSTYEYGSNTVRYSISAE